MTENAVALKLPAFWTSQPEIWFTQAEAQFHIRNITADTTKYFYVVASLDQETAGQLLDVLRAPPEQDKYQHLKRQLLQKFGLNRRNRAAKLLDMPCLGDRKPSELLADMRSLSDGHTSCMLFEELFLRHMPTDIRMQLAEQDFSDLDAVAERADALWQVKAADARGISSETMPVLAHTVKKVTPPARPPTVTSEGLCFYHTKFGDKAKKCRAPCTFPGNVVAGRQ